MSSRLDAVKLLLDDEDKRKEKSEWKAIFDAEDLSPLTSDPKFASLMFELLTREMNEGYRRKDELVKELRRKNGRAGRYTPSQMRITSKVGRYIFAVFKWHDVTPNQPNGKTYYDLAEAFKFQIDPAENRLQKISDKERNALIEEIEDEDYRSRNMTMIFIFLGGLISAVMYMLRKTGHY